MCMRVWVCKCVCVCECMLKCVSAHNLTRPWVQNEWTQMHNLKRTAFQKCLNIKTALKQKALSGTILTSTKYKHPRGENKVQPTEEKNN